MVADEKVNMVGVRTQENGDRTVSVFLTLETTGISQLSRLMTKLETIRGVMSVTRALDRRRGAAEAIWSPSRRRSDTRAV